jgi:hypothetical protein
MTLYQIVVNEIPFTDTVDQPCKDYILERLRVFDDLKITITEVKEEQNAAV